MVGCGDPVVTDSDMVPPCAEHHIPAEKTHIKLLHNDEVKETRLNRLHTVDSICMTFCGRQNHSCRHQVTSSRGVGQGGRGWTLGTMRELSGVAEIFYIMIEVVVPHCKC